MTSGTIHRVVASLPIPVREWWCRRSWELRDAGHPATEAEKLAFVECNGHLAPVPPIVAEELGPCPAWVYDDCLTFSSRDIQEDLRRFG